MKGWRGLYPLLVLGFSLSPLWGLENGNPPKKVFQIPIEVKQKTFIPKPVEEVPKQLPLKVGVEINAQKVGLVYPKEIFIPHERVKPQGGGFFSCGAPSDKALYSQAVELFNRGDLRGAEAKFLELLYKYPNSPFTLKAKYYLGVIAFEEGDYAKAYRIFKELCNSPYRCAWKRFACYNAVISGLYIGKHDFEAARSNPFWEHFLLWLEGKEDDQTFLGHLNCQSLELPYRNYCLYLRAFLNPSFTGNSLPPYYLHSLELRKALLSMLSGRTVSPDKVAKFISDPKYGTDFEYFYTYYLINWGEFQKAISYLRDLYKKAPRKAEKLAQLIVATNPLLGPEVISAVNTPSVWKVYLTALYNRGNYRYVLRYAPQLELYRLAAYAAYALGDYADAVKYLYKIENRNPTDERILLDSLLRLREWDKFLSELQRVREKYPDLYKEYLGWYYYYRGDWTKAAALLKEPLYKAVAYFNLGAYQKALKLLEGINTPQAEILKAKAFLALGDFDRAQKVLERLQSPEALYLRGLALFAEEKYREAASLFKKLMPYREKYPQAVVRLADCYYNMGDYDEAKRYYLLYLKENPKGREAVDAYIGLINVYLATGDPSIADYVYRAVEKYPDLVGEGVKLKLAEAFVQNGEIEKAKKLLEELIKSKDPYVSGKAYLLLAEIEPQRREEYLKKALEVGTPQIKSQAVVELAEYYLSKGEKKKAQLLLEEYGKYVTDMGKLVDLYIRLGDFRKLYYLLQELIAADNSYTKVALDIAKRYHRIEFYKLATYSLDPKVAAEALYRLETIYLNGGNLRKALKYALLLKVRKLKVEPIYSKAIFKIAKALYERGYIGDACKLTDDVNEKYLSVEQKLKLETIKVNCSQ
ncbi:MAG TPA: tetratricopeptide repeat protein [Aquificales bacterium]|nr:tetratricopeptide repeat protein [Aquificales bacterium]